ncbi:hypothetical protein [Streptomyces luteolus]|uniref:Secreted protein n=1 Tax=Streptomyces luteolus TaxID=3043615 RepID=A0ABT6SXC8_9ACTN|nr:hypothetical protein [Streptomyces sp. B-S-A12]MDI3419499.1 hypothetical protein [Streptomyces sp. B-S-A12]
MKKNWIPVGAVALTVGVAGGFYGERTLNKDVVQPAPRILCYGSEVNENQAKQFDNLMPDGTTLVSTSGVEGEFAKGDWRYECSTRMMDAGASLEIVSSITDDSVGSWETDRRLEGATKKVSDIGTLALAGADSFSIYARCQNKDEKRRNVSLSVNVVARGTSVPDGGEGRQALAEIAVQQASSANRFTHCEPADAIPDSAILAGFEGGV